MTDAMRDAVRADCADCNPDCQFPDCCSASRREEACHDRRDRIRLVLAAIAPHTAAAVAEAVKAEREAIIVAIGAHDKTGRGWVPGSFWDTLTNETIARIRSRTQEST